MTETGDGEKEREKGEEEKQVKYLDGWWEGGEASGIANAADHTIRPKGLSVWLFGLGTSGVE